MIQILLAEDNQQLAEILRNYAEKEGMQVSLAYDGQQAWELFQKENFDVVLLDVMMPKVDGYELCRRIRRQSIVPIIMLTAKGEDYERVMGLELGADDYIVKPFSLAEVMARVKAILRRVEFSNPQVADVITIGELKIDAGRHAVLAGNQPVLLTKREFEILWTLAENPQKIFSRENLLDSLWGYDYYGDSRVVDTHIKRLRAKLPGPEELGCSVATVRGLGYKLQVGREDA